MRYTLDRQLLFRCSEHEVHIKNVTFAPKTTVVWEVNSIHASCPIGMGGCRNKWELVIQDNDKTSTLTPS